ncbi:MULTISPECIES: tripartite tricarboxylate transporter substrate-binding protein [unclassified Sinorhizobium]|uniref:Bug family tripartite tricarboxylate transporter substrate binding protein n=1 Tax=unclassified Sinorhizobium TaxID=2613772 RepID=UPI0024C22872|nr:MULTISPECIES: tripartite tricarboxylate transporter substrate-binding protein [unclassified Sinorhizobium]MDK1374629.1 tripartite tricarboxylate transporter substrate-binding protein [Sinorhizobium sp. 6-70]MDK1481965.1 tripartite tricarboxylate transporter substrate-binding protein [Sinorhizobium sp. 6-117]
MKWHSIRMAACATAALLTISTAAAWAQEGKEFFNGKTVNYIVATGPGGGYDTNGRLVAQFMQKYLPGSTFVVQNMPGAGHLIGANYIYASEPDGLTFGTFNTGLIYGQLGGDPGIKFDLADMSWIGKVASDPRVIVVSKDSGIESYEQLKALKEPIRFASAGVGSASTIETTMLVNALHLPIQIVSGYNGSDDQLALRRGEVQGIIASRSSFQQFVDEGNGRIIAQIGGSETDVPQLASLVDDADAKKVIALVASQSNISRLTAGPNGIPEDRLKALRDAYNAATSDPEFLEKAKSLSLPVDPKVGDDVAVTVKAALDQTPEIVEFLKEALLSRN